MTTIEPPFIYLPLVEPASKAQQLLVADADQNALAGPCSRALVCVEAADSDCFARFSELLSRRHRISLDVAAAINLTALSAAAGSSKTVKNPLGGAVSAALNVIVEDATHASTRRAARQALLVFEQQVEKKIIAHQEKGSKHLRHVRMELEAECAQALRRLHSPPEKPQEPLTIPVSAEYRKKDALADAAKEAEQTAERLRLFEFEERPFVVIDGLSARDIPELPQRAFDGAVFNFSTNGDALRRLETSRPQERRDLIRYFTTAWHGQPFMAGAETIIAPTVTNVWLLGIGDAARAWSNAALAASGLLETFLLVSNDSQADPDPDAFTEDKTDEQWRAVIDVVLGERIMGEVCEHELSEPAAKRFLEFHARAERPQTSIAKKMMAWRPEQLLKITLLLHLASPNEVPKEISLATLESAIAILERLGAEQLRTVEPPPSLAPDLEAEIEVMMAKARLYGPLKKRDLFRKFNVQRCSRLEPVLALCRERELIRIEDGFLHPVPASP